MSGKDRQMAKNKVVITCAITGAIYTPTMSPYLPVTPKQISDSAIEAAKAGAAILHLHARDPEDGRPASNPELFFEFMSAIKQETDAVLNMSTGGGLTMTVDQRLAAALAASPEMCSLNMGSMNFAIFPWRRSTPLGSMHGSRSIWRERAPRSSGTHLPISSGSSRCSGKGTALVLSTNAMTSGTSTIWRIS